MSRHVRTAQSLQGCSRFHADRMTYACHVVLYLGG